MPSGFRRWMSFMFFSMPMTSAVGAQRLSAARLGGFAPARSHLKRLLKLGRPTHPDSASELITRGRRLAESNRHVARKVASIEKDVGLNPESRV